MEWFFVNYIYFCNDVYILFITLATKEKPENRIQRDRKYLNRVRSKTDCGLHSMFLIITEKSKNERPNVTSKRLREKDAWRRYICGYKLKYQGSEWEWSDVMFSQFSCLEWNLGTLRIRTSLNDLWHFNCGRSGVYWELAGPSHKYRDLKLNKYFRPTRFENVMRYSKMHIIRIRSSGENWRKAG